jgi:hypothetical protein
MRNEVHVPRHVDGSTQRIALLNYDPDGLPRVNFTSNWGCLGVDHAPRLAPHQVADPRPDAFARPVTLRSGRENVVSAM